MAKRFPRRAKPETREKVGNRRLSDYDLGWDLWYARKPLPIGASRAMQQGFVNGAKCTDKVDVAIMRMKERKGLFEFLPRFGHLSWRAGNPLKMGAESRYPVRLARAHVTAVKMMG